MEPQRQRAVGGRASERASPARAHNRGREYTWSTTPEPRSGARLRGGPPLSVIEARLDVLRTRVASLLAYRWPLLFAYSRPPFPAVFYSHPRIGVRESPSRPTILLAPVRFPALACPAVAGSPLAHRPLRAPGIILSADVRVLFTACALDTAVRVSSASAAPRTRGRSLASSTAINTSPADSGSELADAFVRETPVFFYASISLSRFCRRRRHGRVSFSLGGFRRYVTGSLARLRVPRGHLH